MTDKSAEAFRTISEVAESLDLPQHVLRFWETRFPQIKPLKRGGGRRYYRPDDVELLKGIRYLLYVRGFTIKGVQKILKESGNRAVMAIGAGDLTGVEAMQARRPTEAAQSQDVVAEPVDEAPNDQGREKGFGSFSNLLKRDRDHAASNGSLPGDSIAKLNTVILELLELKRLLDQVR